MDLWYDIESVDFFRKPTSEAFSEILETFRDLHIQIQQLNYRINILENGDDPDNR